MIKTEVEKFYDKSSKNYEKTHAKRFVDEIFEHFIIDFLPKKKGLRILDAGGGIGRFSFPLTTAHNVVLTDISSGMLNKAKKLAKKLRIENMGIFRESVTNMSNQSDKSFDVVLVMNGILSYCGNHKKALNEICRVLKPGGMIIGTVNNRFIYCTTHELKEGNVKLFRKTIATGNRIERGINFWTHDFDLNELKKELQKSKFEIIDILGPTNLLRKWEYPEAVNKNNWKDFVELQINWANKKEYIHNSNDFLFVARKK